MKDRLAAYPGRYTAVVDTENIEKGAPFNIQLSRNDEPTEEGTPYNKESVLPDDLAALICAGIEDPTPADAFRGVYNGSARSGYGLGESNAIAQNWNTQARNGFYKEKLNSPDGENLWYGVTCSCYSGEATNIAFDPDFTEGSTMALRHRKGSSFSEWEYVNPPMVEGVAYRTTERFNGKPVYAKLLNCGALPNATNKQIFVANNISNIVRVEGYLENNAGYILQTPISNASAVAVYLYNHSELRLSTTSDYSTWDAHIAVYYTLDE